ncbi:MAG: adenylate/guanylate cyclase domain-containing protein [Nitrososphaerales archaeon]
MLLAIELHEKIKAHNAKFPAESLKVRIGINDGPVYVVRDVMGQQNIWGPGTIFARRVMDVGEEGHILVSQRVAKTLRELSDEYRVLIKPLHDYTFKHGIGMLLYSVYGDGIGNPKTPTKNLNSVSRMAEALRELRLYTLYEQLDVSLEIKDPKSMLTHHKKVYHINCTSNEPIQSVLHGISTDVPKSFNDLNIRVTDENGKEWKIKSINFDKPYQKEFTIAFNKPIYKGEKNHSYTLEYDSKKRYRFYEKRFFIEGKVYVIRFIHPSDVNFKAALYEVNAKTTKKARCKIKPVTE